MVPRQLSKCKFILVRNRGKIPVEKEWQTKRHYDYDSDNIQRHLKILGNLGIATGHNNLLVVDYDDVEFMNLIKPHLPETMEVMTGSGGIHQYFYVDDTKSWKVTHKDDLGHTLADMQGVGKQVVAPNSIHPNGNKYYICNDIDIAPLKIAHLRAVIDAKVSFAKLSGKHISNETTQFETSSKLNDFNHSSLSGEYDKIKDEIRSKISISSLLSEFGVNTSRNPTDCPFHSSKSHQCLSFDSGKEVYHCFHCESQGDVFSMWQQKHSCDFMKALTDLANKCGVELPKKKTTKPATTKKPTKTTDKKAGKKSAKQSDDQDEEEDTVQRTSFFADDKIIIEQVYDKALNESHYVKYDSVTKQFDRIKEYEHNGKILKPIVGEELVEDVVILPTKATDYVDEDVLDERIKNFIYKWLDVDKLFLYNAINNIKFYWLYDRFETVNYLRALGDTGTGKSRFMNTLGFISYKTMITTGATTVSPLFRMISKWGGTLMIDESDVKQSDETNDFIKLLNIGYEKNSKIMRCDTNNKEKINFFKTYCPKILGTRKTFEDKATEARCVTTIMSQTSRKDIPFNLNDTFYTEAEEIRQMLLYYRLTKFHSLDTTYFERPEIKNKLYKYEPRIIQVNSPIINLFQNDEDKLKNFFSYLDIMQTRIKAERADSYDGWIVQAVANLITERDLMKGEEVVITATDIRKTLTEFDSVHEHYSIRNIGAHLKTLGFIVDQKKINGRNIRCIIWKKSNLSSFERYLTNSAEAVKVLRCVDSVKALRVEQQILDLFKTKEKMTFDEIQIGINNGLTQSEVAKNISRLISVGDIYEPESGLYAIPR